MLSETRIKIDDQVVGHITPSGRYLDRATFLALRPTARLRAYLGLVAPALGGAQGVVPCHACHALGCEVEVPRTLLVCCRHWRMVPFRLRLAVMRASRAAQTEDQRARTSYVQAATQAIIAIAEQEGRTVPRIYRQLARGEG